MEKLVFCKKYKKELPALEGPPYPGPKGKEIFETISKKAWMEWLSHQTMLINEGNLNLTEKSTRKWLNEQMDSYFNNENYERPKGYVPID